MIELGTNLATLEATLKMKTSKDGRHFEVAPINYLPSPTLAVGREMNKWGYPAAEVAEYLSGSFWVYRESLITDGVELVPHQKNQSGVYEWLKPTSYNWEDEDRIRYKASLLKEQSAKALVQSRNEAPTVKFEIRSLANIGFVQDTHEWQQTHLKAYVNPLDQLIEDLRKGRIDEGVGRNYLEQHLQQLSTRVMKENVEIFPPLN